MQDKEYLIPSWLYPYLKWGSMTILPALSTFVLALGNIWGWDFATPVAGTITAVGALVGTACGFSQATAKPGSAASAAPVSDVEPVNVTGEMERGLSAMGKGNPDKDGE